MLKIKATQTIGLNNKNNRDHCLIQKKHKESHQLINKEEKI